MPVSGLNVWTQAIIYLCTRRGVCLKTGSGVKYLTSLYIFGVDWNQEVKPKQEYSAQTDPPQAAKKTGGLQSLSFFTTTVTRARLFVSEYVGSAPEMVER